MSAKTNGKKDEKRPVNILIAVSKSPRSVAAVYWTLRNPLGLIYNQVTLLHVAKEDEIQAGWELFDRLDKMCKLSSISKYEIHRVILQEPEIAKAIYSFCAETNVDLLVVGKKEESQEIDKLILHSSCSVVLAGSPQAPPQKIDQELGQCKRISLLVNDNPSSHCAFKWLCAKVNLCEESNITLVHGYVDFEDEDPKTADEAAKLRDFHRKILRSFSDGYDGKPPAKTALVRLRGEPKGYSTGSSVLSVFLRDHPALPGEMTIIAPHYKSGESRIGSWTESVRALQMDVMIYKERKKAPRIDELKRTEKKRGHWVAKHVTKLIRAASRRLTKSISTKDTDLQALQKRAVCDLDQEDWEMVNNSSDSGKEQEAASASPDKLGDGEEWNYIQAIYTKEM